MKVLVTGAAGFLGGATVTAARAAGYEVVAAARKSPGLVACDLRDPAAILDMLGSVGPDAIINCGADADFGRDVLHRQYAVNVLAPATMAHWAAGAGAHLSQVSATLVHGARAEHITAESPVAPDTDYGRSKWLAEEMVGASGCSASVVRIGGIFGGDGPDHLALNRAIRGARAGVTPEVVGSGRARRNYIHVADAADALVRTAARRMTGVYRLGGRDVLTIAEMVTAICDVFLPGQVPTAREGTEGRDQVVEVSHELRPGRSFRDALASERDTRNHS